MRIAVVFNPNDRPSSIPWSTDVALGDGAEIKSGSKFASNTFVGYNSVVDGATVEEHAMIGARVGLGRGSVVERMVCVPAGVEFGGRTENLKLRRGNCFGGVGKVGRGHAWFIYNRRLSYGCQDHTVEWWLKAENRAKLSRRYGAEFDAERDRIIATAAAFYGLKFRRTSKKGSR